MYVPTHFVVDDGQLGQLVADFPVADLVTVTPEGLLATFLPVLYEPTTGELGSLIGHVARGNEQWCSPVLAEALVILHGLNAYVSPSWYPSKAEHGRVVPTWDYLTAHVYGRFVVHDDAAWVESLVRRLTATHEAGRPRPWSVDDAPATFTAAQVKGIVGVEVIISRVQVKAKWSQNRPGPDIDGVISGLEASGQSDAAAAVRQARP
jgi:transcriptional regulator